MWAAIISAITSLGMPTMGAKLFVFALLEKWYPAELRQPLWAYLLNLRITLFYLIASSYWANMSATTVSKVGAYLGFGLIDLRFSAGRGMVLQVLAGLLTILVVDFFYYWFHRLQHVVPAFWAQHKIHHLDESLNASTASRHHWLEELFRIPFLAVPLAVLFKFDPMPAGVMGVLFASWGYFIHANLRIELGFFSVILGGPQVHRIHHSRLPEHFDKNFAAFFPVWDIIFKTYYHPKRREFPETGIPGEKLMSATNAAILPFYIWLKMLWTKFFLILHYVLAKPSERITHEKP